jgi:beta-galactosidase
MWLAMRDNPPYAGQFIWTGIDYLGESPGWPTIGHGSGLLDRTGTARSVGFERQSWWSARPMVHITRRVAPTQLSPADPGYEPGGERLRQVLYSDWTPRNTAAHDENVEVYSNCEQVELFLNDKSLGIQPRPADDAPRTWKVPFQAGTLKAIATNRGEQVASYELTTAGAPARIILSADRATIAPVWDDVSYITATVVDAKGVIVPNAAELISFNISGPGVIAAVDNGDNNSHEPFQATARKAYQGRCFALIKSGGSLKKSGGSGRITIAATAQGLTGASTTIQARPALRR